ncbi:MAG: type I-E CRISPR-associated protein Cas5/CasD [Acidobacteria bacterium]|nr:type I-E CRISPR-associated protein Cas5/CasD [Acidobacteriota bacterium]MCK6681276.1 type I-E CRISPR-associated protein Cas5/CasD [Thermoanaerobaculia bacterium]
MKGLILRLEAPLMSFGGPLVDNLGKTMPFPGRGLLTGLIANALGWDHGEAARLGALQKRIRYAVRCDREGRNVLDYQTADLGQRYMMNGSWTTRGRADSRGGQSGEGTAIRYRSYLADAVYTVALTLDPVKESPDLDQVEEALREPERPLFLGRKTCLPAAPLLECRFEAAGVGEALQKWPLHRRADRSTSHRAWWPANERPDPGAGREIAVTDDRDWENQVCSGRRWIREGSVAVVEEESHAG